MPFGSSGDTPEDPSALRLPRRRDLLKTLGVVGTTALAGCSGQGPDGSGTPASTGTPTTEPPTNLQTSTPPPTPEGGERRSVGGTYISGASTDAESLFWIQTADAPSSARVGTTLDGAYAVTIEDEVFPLWLDISSDDKRVYECTLRDGLEWSDPYGQMTAEDWVYMITEVFQGEDNWAGFANQGDWIRNNEFIPVEETGELSFEIRLPEVDPAFPLRPIMWGSYCLPKGLLEQYVPDRDVEGLKQDEEIQTLGYAGNLGPYRFERWDRESQFVVTRNPDYYMHDAEDVPEKWRGAPYFERYVIKVIPEESTRLQALKTGEVTATGIPANKVKQFEGLDRINVIQSPQPFIALLIYNQRANGWTPFRDRAVRHALSYAIDKQTVVDTILRGYATVAHTFQPPWSRWFDDSRVRRSGIGDRYDPERATELLADALPSAYGYDGAELVGPEGDQVELKLVYPVGTETTKTIVEFIAQSYGQIGIDVQIKGVQFNTLLTKYVRNAPKKGTQPEWSTGPFNGGNRDESTSQEAWDMQYGIIFNSYPRTPTSTRVFWEQRGDTNYYGYYPSIDMKSLYDTAATAVDEDERRSALAEIFGVLSEDQPGNFINLSASITGYQDTVAGFGPIAFGYGWDSTTWYFSQ